MKQLFLNSSLITTCLCLGLACGGSDPEPGDGGVGGTDSGGRGGSSNTGGSGASSGAGTSGGSGGGTQAGDDASAGEATDGGFDGGFDPGTTDDARAPGLLIAGRYMGAFSETITLDEGSYLEEGTGYSLEYVVVVFDNDARFFVTRDSSAATGQYSKYVWTFDGDDLYVCTALFLQDTLADARGSDDSDPTDLDTGCGGTFPWSAWTPL